MSDVLVVLDSGPIIALASVGQLDLLGTIYSRALVPDAVYREVTVEGSGRPGARELIAASWIERVALDRRPDPLLAKELGIGEAEAISLAHRRKIPRILLDDRRARRIAAQAYGLKVRGTAAVLVAAKRIGLVESVRSLLMDMKSKGYFFSDRVMEHACKEAGE